MAITNMKGDVSAEKQTMTGMINQKPDAIKPPKLSGMNKLFTKKTEPQIPVEQSKEMSLVDKVQNLTDQDKAVLTTVLSPSVSNVLKKLAPDLTPLLDEAGSAEENVIIPVSVVKNYATKRYGGQNESEAVTSFISDLQQSVPNMTNTMDQPVPPEPEDIDQGLV